jgi:glutathione synthase/RimK-type ligase-like ATP-grasp enzyme
VAARLLVTGAGTGPGNNVITSLRRGDGTFVIVGCHDDRFSLKKSTAQPNYLVPSAAHPGFVRALRRIVAAERIDLLIPTADADVRVVARHRARIPCRVFLPRRSVIELCQDKFRVTAFLRARSVPVPLTYPVTRLSDVGRLFRRLAPDPLVWCRVRRGSGSMGATPVATPEQARNWMRYWKEMRGVAATAFTLCEYLPGRDFGCQSVWHEGRLVLAKTFERLTYFAGEGQPSGVSSVAALARSVDAPRVVQVCAAAVRALDPKTSGLYCIDLKEDGRGVPCITDINVGRLSLSTHIYDLVGKHSTALTYVRLALGEPVEIDRPYDAVEGYYMVRDVDTLPDIFHADELFEGIRDARGEA